MTGRDFDDVYDAQTVELIDAHRNRPASPGALAPASPTSVAPEARRRVRQGFAGAALATALVTGVRESLEDTNHEEYEEIEDGVFGGPDQFVTLFFVPNNPHATRHCATVAAINPGIPGHPGTPQHPGLT